MLGGPRLGVISYTSYVSYVSYVQDRNLLGEIGNNQYTSKVAASLHLDHKSACCIAERKVNIAGKMLYNSLVPLVKI